MATERQILANRANAKRSTGPKTIAGRSVSKRNALRHGLSSSISSPHFLPLDVDRFAEALVEPLAQESQIVVARQLARTQVELMRVRAARSALLLSLDPAGGNVEVLRQILSLERYELGARAKRRRATVYFLSQ